MPDAAVADFIVVVARDGVFAVDAKAPGLTHRADARHGPDAKAIRR